MNGGSAVKIRFVRCPKCMNVLLEPQDIPVYKCGVCSTFLQAKIRKSNPEVATSGLHETGAAQKNRSDHITEAKESSISNREETLLYSGERSSDQPNGMDSALSSDEPRGSGSDRNGSGDFDNKQNGGVNSSHNQKNESDKNDPGESDNEYVVGVRSSNEHQQNGSGQNEPEDFVDLKLRGVSLSSDDQERGNDPNESPECDREQQPENFDEVQIQQIESGDCNDEQLGGMGGTSTEARNDWSERNDSSDCSVDQAGFSYKVCSPTKLDEEVSSLAAAKPIAEVNEGEIQQNESGAFSDEQLGSVNLSTEAENDGSGQNESEDCVDLKLRGVSLSSDDQERGNDPNESPECDHEQPENFGEVQIQQIESGNCNDEQLGGMGGTSIEARNDWSERNDSLDCSVDQAGFSYKVCSPTKLDEEVSPLAAAKPIAEVNEGEIQQNESGAFSDEQLGSVNLSTEAENDGSGQNESEDCVDLKLRGVSLSSDDQERGNDPNESPECDHEQPENFGEVQIQQIESGNCNDEQLGGMGGTSTEARNDWSERNDSLDCSVDQAGFSNKVCSPTKLDEEVSSLAAAKPIAEVNEGEIQQNESGAFSDEQLGSVNLSTEAENDGSGQNESEDCVDLKLRGVSLSSDDQERGNDPNESPECDQEQPENFGEVQIQQIESGDCNDEQLGGMGGTSTEARNDWSEQNDSLDCSVDQAGFSYKVCSPTKLDEEVSPLAAAKPIAEVNEGEIQQNESGAFSDEQLGSVNLSTEAENDGSGQNESEDCVDLKLRGVSLSSDDQERGNDPNESPECDQEQPENFGEVQIQQIESGDCNDEQLGGMGGISTEARNDWSERNDSSDCSVDQAGFSNKVCSPTKLDEEVSPLAAAKPIADVNEGEIQQNESGAFSDEQLGRVNLSTEAENDGSGQNDSLDFSIQQAVISCEVCSPTKHAHLKNKEHSPLAGEKSIVEVSDESSPSTVAKAEFDANNDSDGTSNNDCSLAKLALHEKKELSSVEGEKSEGGASSGSSQLAGAKALLDASKDSDYDFIKSSFEKSVDMEGASVVAAQRPAEESSLSDIFIPSLNEQPEKLHETGCHDVDCVQFTDTFKTIDLIDPSSELSDGLIDLSKSPTTRSSRAYYDDAVSSYEGTDDRLPDRPKHPFRNTHKQANHAASNERPRSEKFVLNSSLEMQHHLKSHTSIISDKNHRALKFSKLNDDKLVEHTRVVHPARNWRTLEENFLAGYDKGSPSNLNNNESHSNPYFHSRDKAAYTEQEKMKLLEMIYELQDQVNILHGKEKGRVTPGVTWKDHNPSYYDHLEQLVFDDYPSYPGRFRGGSNWHQQSKYPRIPFSADVASKRNQVDHLLCCCSQDWCLAQPPPPNLHNNRVFCKANDRVEFYHSYGSCPSTPQRHANSEFSIYRRETHSDDHRRRDHEVRNYARKKHHLAKRHLLPLAGGAPFITCSSCFKQLQLPADFLLSKRKYHQLRCGVCSEVLRFSLVSRTHLVPYTPSADAPPPSAADEHSGVLHMRNSVSSSHASNCPNVDPVSFSEDYGLPFYKSCSTDGDPVQTSLRSAERGQPYNSVEYREERKKIILNERRKNPEETPELSRPSSSMSITKKVSSEIEELPRKGGGSPLHRLMGYSSPGRLIYGYEPSCSSSPYH
ncbi:hypothetical protein SADUNF_Sadunf19G0069500 [Salix dunnii]|uniref:Zinc-ribbon domain-containing protein n=1 Tax=Salix dunnii TaxID=1413687 RepID=A0A835MFB4_9ROSI|nr:hypothetical protein SADUNF_Sadunf19G0069500 [Salix dunnii]